MSARKIGVFLLILLFGAVVEIAWNIRENRFSFGPEGLRVLGGHFYGPSFEFEETAERALEGEGGPEVEVHNAFGDVRIEPSEGPLQVRLRKVVFQPTEAKARAFADRLEIEIRDDDGRLRVGTNREDVSRGEKVGFETHLEIRVPPETVARVRNDHGAVSVRGVAGARVRNSFEDVRVEEVTGDVRVDARHGAVVVADLGAALKLDSRYGDVEVSDVTGPAEVEVQHGRLSVRNAGELTARVAFGDVQADSVAGDVWIRGRHAGARASNVTGKVDVETTYADVEIEGTGGPIKARVTHGDAHLAPGVPIARAIDAAASDGRVTLQVPEGSRFDLDAESRRGRVELDVPGLDATVTEGEGDAHQRARGSLGDAEARVTIRARGDVTIEAAPAPLPAEKE